MAFLALEENRGAECDIKRYKMRMRKIQRNIFEEKFWLSIIWNNKDLRINGLTCFFTKRITTPESALSMICC